MSAGCKYTATFLLGAGLYRVGQYAVQTAFSAGAVAVITEYPQAVLSETCTATMGQYIDYWKGQENLSYSDYLDGYCNGDAFTCNDPNLSPQCPWDPTGSCIEPHPNECQFFSRCLPYINQIGVQPVSVLDLMNGLGVIESSYHQGFWERDTLEPIINILD
ncbi:hypothetical protein QWY20_17235 [Alkalimonas sp. MEB108]|uniref:Uncharacterized protein n=1 Tax=Alkalimonas cellulosilytica TaxID=3058395 RepID=A0ABU7J9L9_9GAMM|nr:hypothetical protein [Alkalimonas sp. MEB108]MEE2003201.1 hypothetical protein [Alkalimonas sp. MEB108]